MGHVACELKLRSLVRSFMHPCLENCMAIERAVVCYARTGNALSARIKFLLVWAEIPIEEIPFTMAILNGHLE